MASARVFVNYKKMGDQDAYAGSSMLEGLERL